MLAILRHRRVKAGAVSILTLVVGVGALMGADYGMPVWLQVPLYLWLLTIGLPTTLTVLGLAACWGHCEPFYGLVGFKLVVVLLAPILHVMVLERIRRRPDPTSAVVSPAVRQQGVGNSHTLKG